MERLEAYFLVPCSFVCYNRLLDSYSFIRRTMFWNCFEQKRRIFFYYYLINWLSDREKRLWFSILCTFTRKKTLSKTLLCNSKKCNLFKMILLLILFRMKIFIAGKVLKAHFTDDLNNKEICRLCFWFAARTRNIIIDQILLLNY